MIPDDPNPPLRPSGIRLGTPAATTRGMKETEMVEIGHWLMDALTHSKDTARLAKIRKAVEKLCSQFPVPGIA